MSNANETNQDLVADGLLTVREACDFLKVSQSELYRLMERGEIQFCRLGSKRRIPKKALVDFAAAGLVKQG